MSVNVQDDFWDAAQYMPDDQAREFVYALVRFGMTGEEPEPFEPWYPTFVACKGRVELSVAKQRKARGMAEARWQGRDGKDEDAAPDQASCTGDAKHDARDEASTMHDGDQASCTGDARHRPEKESESEKESEKEMKGARRARARFSPPSADDVSAYAAERGLDIDAAAFVDFYAAKGWKVGTSPMRDWRAAVRNWCRRDGGRGRPGPSGQAPRGAVRDEYAEL
nr:MAG TPA: DNA-binding domain protein [Caudoviricetes sp.]